MTLYRFINLFALITLFGTLTACSTMGPQSAGHESAKSHHQQLKFKLASGVYRCELDQRIEIQRDARNANLIKLNWQGNLRTLQRYDSTSGLPRYEDRQNGLL